MISWTKEDADQWRTYLTQTDNKLIKILRMALPRVDADSFQKVALQAKGRQDAEDIIATAERLAEEVSQTSTPSQSVDISTSIPK